jgi:hypothetical protein
MISSSSSQVLVLKGWNWPAFRRLITFDYVTLLLIVELLIEFVVRKPVLVEQQEQNMSRFLAGCLLASVMASGLMDLAYAGGANRELVAKQNEPARAPEIRPVAAEQEHAAQEFAQQAQEARRAQEQSVRAQEDQARKAQQEVAQQQIEQARKAQQEFAKQQETQARNAQQAMEKQQAIQARNGQQEMVREEQARQLQAQALAKQQQNRMREEATAMVKSPEELLGAGRPRNEQPERLSMMPSGHTNAFNVRPAQPRPLSVAPLPLAKAISMPVLQANISAEEREHAQVVLQNLNTHLLPVAAAQAPPNWGSTSAGSISNYVNNYNTIINNQPIVINRQNTYINPVPQYEYPAWWNPGSYGAWRFSNGFILGSLINVGLDWLRWGWHPYYGPPPEGFVSAVNYIPTQWIYVPAYGLWRQAGIMGWSQFGPPYDYTGPITVETLEPKHVSVRDPYTGLEDTTIINVPYLYNAFYYPEEERWGFMNRHDYFVWLNV